MAMTTDMDFAQPRANRLNAERTDIHDSCRMEAP